MNDDVQKWVKRNNKKQPKLLSVIRRECGNTYRILYTDKGKVRIGVVSDGMRSRYGIACMAAMEIDEYKRTGSQTLALWMANRGSVDSVEVDAMVAYYHRPEAYPSFNFECLKEVQF